MEWVTHDQPSIPSQHAFMEEHLEPGSGQLSLVLVLRIVLGWLRAYGWYALGAVVLLRLIWNRVKPAPHYTPAGGERMRSAWERWGAAHEEDARQAFLDQQREKDVKARERAAKAAAAITTVHTLRSRPSRERQGGS